jgi:hypothetical protein
MTLKLRKRFVIAGRPHPPAHKDEEKTMAGIARKTAEDNRVNPNPNLNLNLNLNLQAMVVTKFDNLPLDYGCRPMGA